MIIISTRPHHGGEYEAADGPWLDFTPRLFAQHDVPSDIGKDLIFGEDVSNIVGVIHRGAADSHDQSDHTLNPFLIVPSHPVCPAPASSDAKPLQPSVHRLTWSERRERATFPNAL